MTWQYIACLLRNGELYEQLGTWEDALIAFQEGRLMVMHLSSYLTYIVPPGPVLSARQLKFYFLSEYSTAMVHRVCVTKEPANTSTAAHLVTTTQCAHGFVLDISRSCMCTAFRGHARNERASDADCIDVAR